MVVTMVAMATAKEVKNTLFRSILRNVNNQFMSLSTIHEGKENDCWPATQ